MATLKNTTVNNTGALQLPVGTTAQRPSATSGNMRYNTTLDTVEVYDGTIWRYMPDVVRRGLVLHLDASDPASYSGSGNIWNDLSGVIGNVNINNRNGDWSFVTDPATGQLCVFNNTNRISGNSPGINIPMNNGFNKLSGTIEMWIKPSGDYTGGHGFFNNSDGSSYTNASNWLWFGTWSNSDCLYFRQGNAATCCNDVASCSYKSSGYYPLNVWQHLCVTWQVSSGSARIYRNSVEIYSRIGNIPLDIPDSNPTNTGQIFNGHSRSDNMQFKGYCNVYRIYNRALSLLEIQQNYHIQKGRFGL